jgi:hypothetical protein
MLYAYIFIRLYIQIYAIFMECNYSITKRTTIRQDNPNGLVDIECKVLKVSLCLTIMP